ncbi:NADH-quinone oxidoreductase subunit K [Bdellovibrionota bacterium FG-2]
MILALPGIIGGIGLACIIFRKTLLGVLIGVQLLILGAVAAVVMAGIVSGRQVSGHVSGVLIFLSGVALVALGFALAIRMFYLRRRISMSELRTLRQ